MCTNKNNFAARGTQTKLFSGVTEIPANQVQNVSDVQFFRLFPQRVDGYTTKSGTKKEPLLDHAMWSQSKWREVYKNQALSALDPNRTWGNKEAEEVTSIGVDSWVERKMQDLLDNGVSSARYLIVRGSPPQPIDRVIRWQQTEKPTICGAKCRSAKGPNCDCICEGKFHGAGSVFARSEDSITMTPKKSPYSRLPTSKKSMMQKEYVLWGTPEGETDPIHAKVLSTQAKTPSEMEQIKRRASAAGWHSFRVQILDPDKPMRMFARPDSNMTVKGVQYEVIRKMKLSEGQQVWRMTSLQTPEDKIQYDLVKYKSGEWILWGESGRIVAQGKGNFARTGKTSMAQSDFKVGDQVHLGFSSKGAAGFDGIITKIEGETVYIKSPEVGQYGPRTFKGPTKYLSHGYAGHHADQNSRTGAKTKFNLSSNTPTDGMFNIEIVGGNGVVSARISSKRFMDYAKSNVSGVSRNDSLWEIVRKVNQAYEENGDPTTVRIGKSKNFRSGSRSRMGSGDPYMENKDVKVRKGERSDTVAFVGQNGGGGDFYAGLEVRPHSGNRFDNQLLWMKHSYATAAAAERSAIKRFDDHVARGGYSRSGVKANFDRRVELDQWTSPKGTRYIAGFHVGSNGDSFHPFVSATFSDGGEQLMSGNAPSFRSEKGARKWLAAFMERMYSRTGTFSRNGEKSMMQKATRSRFGIAERVLNDGSVHLDFKVFRESLSGKSDSSLNFIMRDAADARDAMGPDGKKFNYYADIVNEVGDEISRRKNGKSRSSRLGDRKQSFEAGDSFMVEGYVGEMITGGRSARTMEEAEHYANAMLANIKRSAGGKPVKVEIQEIKAYSPQGVIKTMHSRSDDPVANMVMKLKSKIARETPREGTENFHKQVLRELDSILSDIKNNNRNPEVQQLDMQDVQARLEALAPRGSAVMRELMVWKDKSGFTRGESEISTRFGSIASKLGFMPDSITDSNGVATLKFAQADGSAGRCAFAMISPLTGIVGSDRVTATDTEVRVQFARRDPTKSGVSLDPYTTEQGIELRDGTMVDAKRVNGRWSIPSLPEVGGSRTFQSLVDMVTAWEGKSKSSRSAGGKAKFGLEREINIVLKKGGIPALAYDWENSVLMVDPHWIHKVREVVSNSGVITPARLETFLSKDIKATSGNMWLSRTGGKAKFGSDVILEDIGDDQVRATARVEGRSAGSFDGPRSQSAQLLLKALKIAGQGHEVSSGVYDMTHITLNDAAKRAMPKSAMMSRGGKAEFAHANQQIADGVAQLLSVLGFAEMAAEAKTTTDAETLKRYINVARSRFKGTDQADRVKVLTDKLERMLMSRGRKGEFAMDQTTHRHLLEWIGGKLGSRAGSAGYIADKMVEAFNDDPDYWSDQGWSKVFDAAGLSLADLNNPKKGWD